MFIKIYLIIFFSIIKVNNIIVKIYCPKNNKTLMTDKFNSDSKNIGLPSKFDLNNIGIFEEMNLTAENKFIHLTSNQDIKVKDLFFLEKKRMRPNEMLSETETEDIKIEQAIKEIFWSKPTIVPDEDQIVYSNPKNDEQNILFSYNLKKEKVEEKNPEVIMKPVPEKIYIIEEEIDLKEKNEEKITDKEPTKSGIKNLKKFSTKTNHTPGRKRKEKNEGEYIKKTHDKNAFDNIITKVQVHFISFLINLSNDVIKELLEEDKVLILKDIDYKIKRNVKSANLEFFKGLTIKDILQMPVSKKFSSINENHNIDILEQVVNISETSKKFFNMNFVDTFEKYFNNCKPLSTITINDKNISLSKETKCFYDLIQKNPMIEKQLIEYSKIVYLKKKKKNEDNKQIFNVK